MVNIRSGINSFLIAITASAVLTSSCVNQTAESQEAESDVKNRQIKERNEFNSLRNDLIAVEQGCEGRILTGAELRTLVVGKSHSYMIPGTVSNYHKSRGLKRFNYHKDGRLFYSNSSPNTFGRYEIYDTQFCHKDQLSSCYRLIESAGGVISAEYLAQNYNEKSSAKKVNLQCVELDIKDLETNG